MNTLIAIYPYKYKGLWVFDDERAGLVKEPFVSGADIIIDRMTAHIPGAENGFRLLFSANPFRVPPPLFNGAERTLAATGTTAASWIERGGCARHCSSTLTLHRRPFTRGLKRRTPNKRPPAELGTLGSVRLTDLSTIVVSMKRLAAISQRLQARQILLSQRPAPMLSRPHAFDLSCARAARLRCDRRGTTGGEEDS